RGKHVTNADKLKMALGGKSGLSRRRVSQILRKLSPADRVREAIRCGAETQTEIAHVTRLPKDEVCDALANLLLWTREIRTQILNHQRKYFVNEVMEELQKTTGTKARRGLTPAFSSVAIRMPARKPSAI